MDLSPTSLADLETLLGRWGYAVIFAAMLLENAGVPLPGETITLLGGYAAGVVRTVDGGASLLPPGPGQGAGQHAQHRHKPPQKHREPRPPQEPLP